MVHGTGALRRLEASLLLLCIMLGDGVGVYVIAWQH